MRRTALLASTLLLAGCTGYGTFLDHAFSLPGTNPNLPMTDSENFRRALGGSSDIEPLGPEPGNVWPGPQPPEPTLADIQQQPATENARGFPPTVTPGAEPNYPAGRQPRPRGSSTPPEPLRPNTSVPSAPGPNAPPPPRSDVPGPGPLGRVVPTPQGPALDSGGTSSYRTLTTPRGPGAIMVPNGNGTSTIINTDGTIQTVPTPR